MNERRQSAEVDRGRRRGWLKSRLSSVIVWRKKAGENSGQCEQPDNEPTKERNAIGSPFGKTIT
jgi:hypothetical protein